MSKNQQIVTVTDTERDVRRQVKKLDKDKAQGNPILCAKCGDCGHTLIKVGEGDEKHYIHRDSTVCRSKRGGK